MVRDVTRKTTQLKRHLNELSSAIEAFDANREPYREEDSDMDTSNSNDSMTLNLSKGLLHKIHENTIRLQNLFCLDLSHNDLETLPKYVSEMIRLKSLNLSYNNIIHAPPELYTSLQFLRILDISHNKLEKFSAPPACLTNLVEINLSHNKLQTIPKWIFDSKCQLKIVNISYNSLSELDEHLCGNSINVMFMPRLCELNLQNCGLDGERLHFISKCINLETLIISNGQNDIPSVNNHIDSFEVDIIEKCSNLKSFCASNVGMSFLNYTFGNLKYIQYLDLSHNFLTWLPDSFCNLEFLKICKLNSNLIYFLPVDFGNLKHLKEIYLNDNNISDLPDSFQFLINMEYCDLYNNKLEHINPGIIDLKSLKGIDLERNYLDFGAIYCDQQICNEFTSKYQLLKEEYRQRFKYERDNFQTINRDEASVPRDFEDLSDEYDIRTNLIIGEDSDLEDWDEEHDSSLTPWEETDDDFDPYGKINN